MTAVFHLPDLGEGLTDAAVVEWKVAVGDTVTVDQVVVEVETAKAVVDVPCPHAGTVVQLHAEAGTSLPVGAPLITVAAGDAAGVGSQPATTPPPEGDRFESYREEEQAGSGAVLIGFGTGRAGRRRRPRVAPAQPAPARPRQQAPRVLSPIVRRLARERGLDLATLAATRPDGVIRRADVEQAATATLPSALPTSLPTTLPSSVPTPTDGERRIPLTGVRGAIADRLSRSRREIPEATTWVDVDATELLAARDALRAARPDRPIGLLALLARICVAGLRRFPELNATVDTEREEIVQLSHVHLGFAAQTDRGLLVPVVRDAGALPTAQLAAEIARLTERARDGRITPTELSGGTFTLNNYGVFGVDGSAAIINHPEAAILGVGRVIDRPWVVDGQIVPRKITQLSLAFDHRVCDGGVAGGFLRYVADCVERPIGLLADL